MKSSVVNSLGPVVQFFNTSITGEAGRRRKEEQLENCVFLAYLIMVNNDATVYLGGFSTGPPEDESTWSWYDGSPVGFLPLFHLFFSFSSLLLIGKLPGYLQPIQDSIARR